MNYDTPFSDNSKVYYPNENKIFNEKIVFFFHHDKFVKIKLRYRS